MADSTSPIQQIAAGSNALDRVNENFDAASPALMYGRDARTSAGLTWGYIGGRWEGNIVPNGTVPLAASSANYVVVDRTTGAVSVSTATTDWSDIANYARAYLVMTGPASVVGYEDHRQVFGVSGGGGGGGDVSGPGGSNDASVARYDGTTGKLLQDSAVTISDTGEISGYRASRTAPTGAAYTMTAADTGRVLEFADASAVVVSLPSGLQQGWCCTVVQAGAGQVSFAAGSGASLRNRQGHTKLAGQWAMATLYVRANSGGNAADYVMCGDTAA